MADEQLYYSKHKIDDLLRIGDSLLSINDEKTLRREKQMKLSKLK